MERADYVSLLNRAVVRLDQNSAEARGQIYDQARRVLRQQLETIEPRLSDAAITKEQQQLEAAIRELEHRQGAPPAASTGSPRAAPAPVSRSVASQAIFCPHCVAESTDQTPGDVSTINDIGRKFYGSAAVCPECASVIRTLWWTAIEVPVIPLGSYRYKTSQESVNRARFWCRKLPKRHWPQIWKTWAIGFVAVVAAVTGYIIYSNYKSK